MEGLTVEIRMKAEVHKVSKGRNTEASTNYHMDKVSDMLLSAASLYHN